MSVKNFCVFLVRTPPWLRRRRPGFREARAFGQWLGEVTDRPVVFFDERFTSAEAEQFLLGAEMTKKRRKKRLDMVAAQIMLSAYLESGGRAAEDPESLDD